MNTLGLNPNSKLKLNSDPNPNPVLVGMYSRVGFGFGSVHQQHFWVHVYMETAYIAQIGQLHLNQTLTPDPVRAGSIV